MKARKLQPLVQQALGRTYGYDRDEMLRGYIDTGYKAFRVYFRHLSRDWPAFAFYAIAKSYEDVNEAYPTAKHIEWIPCERMEDVV